MFSVKWPRLGLRQFIVAFVIFDLFRLLLLLGPTLMIFFACTNLRPMQPATFFVHQNQTLDVYMLYDVKRDSLSEIEDKILSLVEQKCGHEYLHYLPVLWEEVEPTLHKSLYLLGIANLLPSVSAVSFLVFHKRERLSFIIGFVHVTFVIIASALGIFGAWLASDSRLCLLNHLTESLSIQECFWTAAISYAFVCKVCSLYIFHLFVKSRFQIPRPPYHQPSPADELLSYIKELKMHGIHPKAKFDKPHNYKDLEWEDVEQLIKKILIDVRVQVAKLHRDDPLINELLESGKLHDEHHDHHHRRRKSSVTRELSSGPSILKIARLMAREDSEYKLLKQHKQEKGDVDDVEIILPEPDLRKDDD